MRHYRTNRRGIMTAVFVVVLILSLFFFFSGCNLTRVVAPKPPIASPTPQIDLTSPIPSPKNKMPFTDDFRESNNDNNVTTPDAELVDADGNNIADMTMGDTGIFSAKAAAVKQYPKNTNVAAMIAYSQKYIGTKYEYGSNRNTDATFDCSDFTQWVYKQLGMQLPLDSRSQKEYVKQFGSHRWTDWHMASVGDLMFFSSYRGTQKWNYTDVKRDLTTVTHVGIYLGDGKVLHTASKPFGVRVQDIANTHLEWRLVYVGRPY